MRYRFLFLFAICILSACKKEKTLSVVQVIGHAATGLKVPATFYHDNSLEAIHKAMETEGCDGIEIDLQLSASGTLWLFHDAEMSVETNQAGCIQSKTDEELAQIHYSTIRKEKLIRFRDLPFHKLIGKTLMLDLRHYNACEENIISSELMMEQLLMHPEIQTGQIQVYLLTNYEPWLAAFAASPFQLIYSTETWEEGVQVMAVNDIAGLMIKNSKIDKDQVRELKAMGKKIIIFEVRSPKSIRKALKKQPDYLVTDVLRATIIE